MKLLKIFKNQFLIDIKIRDSNFIFECVFTFYHKCHKINFKQVGSYMNSPGWIKKEKKQQ